MAKHAKDAVEARDASKKVPTIVKEWLCIPKRIHRSIDDLRASDLLIRGGAEGWSIAEYVHHLVEANLIASHVVLAALGKPGCIYDWSWVTPDRDWMIRLSYDRAPIEPAVHLLEALTQHVSSLIVLNPRSLRESVNILDTPGAVPRKSTVEKVLQDEVSHANNHIADIESAKQARRGKK